jgi:hypothetical protein
MSTDYYVDGREPDAESEPPTAAEAVRAILDDATGGVDRTGLIERAADIAGTTRTDVIEAIEELVRQGEIYRIDHRYKRTPSHGSDFGGGST